MRIAPWVAFLLAMVTAAAHADQITYNFTGSSWYTDPDLYSLYPYAPDNRVLGSLTLNSSVSAAVGGSSTSATFDNVISGSMLAGNNYITFTNSSVSVRSFAGQPADIGIISAPQYDGVGLTQTKGTSDGFFLSGFSLEMHAAQVLPADTALSTAFSGSQPFTYGFITLDYRIGSDPTNHGAVWYLNSFQQGASVSAVPEPSAILLLVVGLLTVILVGKCARRTH